MLWKCSSESKTLRETGDPLATLSLVPDGKLRSSIADREYLEHRNSSAHANQIQGAGK